jgi:hypothetical protein
MENSIGKSLALSDSARKIIMINASDIVDNHNDVLKEKMEELIWYCMQAIPKEKDSQQAVTDTLSRTPHLGNHRTDQI